MQSRFQRFPILLTVLLYGILSVCFLPVAAANDTQPKISDGGAVLIFSHTTGFRHESIETGVVAVAEIVRAKGILPVASEDPAIFEKGALAPYRAIVFVNTTTKKNDPGSEWLVGKAADHFREWLKNGGAVVGIHAASDSHYFQPWYGEMIGGYFDRHPKGVRPGKVTVKDTGHQSVKGWSPIESMRDEWYVFRNFDPSVNLIVTLDPASIGEPPEAAWPVSWTKNYEGARIFYTSMGHSRESYSDPRFRSHLSNGLDWALGK